MFIHQTIPFPELTHDAETDIRNLHEYTYKLQETLIYTLQNLTLKNVGKGALGDLEMKVLADGGVYIGTRLKGEKPEAGAYGIIAYADKAPMKVVDGASSNI